MTHARFDSLVDRFVDGGLDGPTAAAVEAHAGSCARCAGHLAASQRLAAALSAARPPRAPRHLAEKVMEAVYREALKGAPEASAVRGGPKGRVYRRLGLSFVLTAAVLAVSLLVPSVSYPSLFRTQSAAVDQTGTGGSLVKNMLDGAGTTVRGTLHPSGGQTSGFSGGSSR